MAKNWQTGELVAWTNSDGPGLPPRGPGRRFAFGIAGALGAVFVGIMSTDALCPEHRTWVLSLAMVGLVAVATAIVGLVRGSAWAPWITLIGAGAGVAIGLIDAAHAPQRGQAIAAAFALVVLLSSTLAVRAVRLGLWERRTLLSLRPLDAPASVPTAAGAPAVEGERDAHTTAH